MRRALIALACGLVAALGAAAGPPADLGAWLALALCGLVLAYTAREDRVPLSGAFYRAADLPGAWMLLLGGGFRLLLTRNAGVAVQPSPRNRRRPRSMARSSAAEIEP